MTKKQMEMRLLKCDLTDEEVEAKGRELARVALDAAGCEDSLELAADAYKAEKRMLAKALADVVGRRQSLAEQVSTRTVERDVRCFWFYQLDSGYKILVREDTNRAVTKLAIPDHERQLLIGEELEAANEGQIQMWSKQLEENPPDQAPPTAATEDPGITADSEP